MNKEEIKNILELVEKKKLNVDEALEKLKYLPFEDLGFAKIDHHRGLRKGFPEVVFCESKTIEQIKAILGKMKGDIILATRASEDVFEAVKDDFNDISYNKDARCIVIGKQEIKNNKQILIACAGTSDIKVAEEAAVTSEVMGNKAERLYDVGVAGIHRLLSNKDKLGNANVIIVVAGMEGALASVVSGLVDRPVIGVPTSIGYGASFKGIAPLLTMLNSCSPGVAVVNIDNGFGAGYMASLINEVE